MPTTRPQPPAAPDVPPRELPDQQGRRAAVDREVDVVSGSTASGSVEAERAGTVAEEGVRLADRCIVDQDFDRSEYRFSPVEELRHRLRARKVGFPGRRLPPLASISAMAQSALRARFAA